MIFPSQRVIFFHPGKTAGTAVEAAFGYTNQTHPPNETNYEVFKGWDHEFRIYLQHAPASFMKSRIPAATWRDYFKFASIRNPYDRLVSVFYFQQPLHERRFGNLRGLVEVLPELLRSREVDLSPHFLPQVDHVLVDGELVADMLLRFESLDEDFDALCRRLQLRLSLDRINTATGEGRPKQPSAELYTSSMVEIMQDVYARDFECFGYPQEPPGA